MSTSAQPSRAGAGILEQLQSDVPESPLVDHLRNHLTLKGDDNREPASSSSAAPPAHASEGVGRALRTRDHRGENVVGQRRAGVTAESNNNSNSSTTTIKSDSMVSTGSTGGGISYTRVNTNRFESYLLVNSVSKRHNLGTIARSATAFGVSELIIVGRKDFNAFGSHGASLHVQFRHFHSLPEAALYLKAKDVDICGVEIVAEAKAVHKHPFKRSTAFVLGNEGTGLSKKEMDICSFFVYIPQCGPGTASLNVTVAASIVLHHFAVWAGFSEREREGQKFVVAEKPRRRPTLDAMTDPRAVKERRLQKAAEDGNDDWLLCDGDDDEAESDDASAGTEACTIEFPHGKKSGLLSTLNRLYS